MSMLIALPFACSATVGAAALLWCRGLIPLVVTTFVAAVCLLGAA